jgi:hypothetical protein
VCARVRGGAAEGKPPRARGADAGARRCALQGLLLLSDGAVRALNVSLLPVTLRADDACFGGPASASALLLEAVVGYDTVLINQLHVHFRRGFVHNARAGELLNLNVEASPHRVAPRPPPARPRAAPRAHAMAGR